MKRSLFRFRLFRSSMVVGVLWLFTNWNLSISSCHSCLLTVPAEFEKVPEKPPWCWFPSSQSNQGCRSAGCWFERYLTHLDLSSFFILSHLKERAQCESVFNIVLQERVIPSACWSWGTTDCRPTPSTRASTRSGTKSLHCQLDSFF